MESPFTLRDFKVGQRVELHPATDRWMRGDRYGEVYRVGVKRVFIKMDHSGQSVGLHAADIINIIS